MPGGATVPASGQASGPQHLASPTLGWITSDRSSADRPGAAAGGVAMGVLPAGLGGAVLTLEPLEQVGVNGAGMNSAASARRTLPSKPNFSMHDRGFSAMVAM